MTLNIDHVEKHSVFPRKAKLVHFLKVWRVSALCSQPIHGKIEIGHPTPQENEAVGESTEPPIFDDIEGTALLPRSLRLLHVNVDCAYMRTTFVLALKS